MTQFLLGLAQASSGAPQGGGFMMQMLPILLMVGVFYLLIIRPQARKAKEHQQMLSQIKRGDDVVTTGGILGRVTGVKDDELVLEVQQGVRIRVLRSAVQGRQKTAADQEPAKESKAPAQDGAGK